MKYVIVKQSFMVGTEAVYADTLDEAVAARNQLIFSNAVDGRYEDWKIYENVEDMTTSKFWRSVNRFVEWLENKARCNY